MTGSREEKQVPGLWEWGGGETDNGVPRGKASPCPCPRPGCVMACLRAGRAGAPYRPAQPGPHGQALGRASGEQRCQGSRGRPPPRRLRALSRLLGAAALKTRGERGGRERGAGQSRKAGGRNAGARFPAPAGLRRGAQPGASGVSEQPVPRKRPVWRSGR